jgi:hypothetical protein
MADGEERRRMFGQVDIDDVRLRAFRNPLPDR